MTVNEPLVTAIDPTLPNPRDTPALDVELPLIETPVPFAVKPTMATPAKEVEFPVRRMLPVEPESTLLAGR